VHGGRQGAPSAALLHDRRILMMRGGAAGVAGVRGEDIGVASPNGAPRWCIRPRDIHTTPNG